MEEQIANALNVAIDQAQVVLVPLAVTGLCAWISPFISDSRGKLLMKIINVVGGNIRKASNDKELN